MPEQQLPSFRNPPVVETVLGAQFERVSKFTNAHLGAFWTYLRQVDAEPGWSNVADAPRLEPAFERFDEGDWLNSGVVLRLSSDPCSRLQIRNAAGDAMIQIQNGRLHYNWIGQGGANYPRYRVVRPAFDRAYNAFAEFLAAEGLGQVQPNQWEVSYVNHIPIGSVWNDPGDWPAMFKLLEKCDMGQQLRLESLAGTWHFEIVPRRGRLHVDLRHAKVQDSGQEILLLTLTARGPTDQARGLKDGLDLGHGVIVQGFRDLTSHAGHQYWGLEP